MASTIRIRKVLFRFFITSQSLRLHWVHTFVVEYLVEVRIRLLGKLTSARHLPEVPRFYYCLIAPARIADVEEGLPTGVPAEVLGELSDDPVPDLGAAVAVMGDDEDVGHPPEWAIDW